MKLAHPLQSAEITEYCMMFADAENYSTHTVNFGSEIVQAKHVSGKNVFAL